MRRCVTRDITDLRIKGRIWKDYRRCAGAVNQQGKTEYCCREHVCVRVCACVSRFGGLSCYGAAYAVCAVCVRVCMCACVCGMCVCGEAPCPGCGTPLMARHMQSLQADSSGSGYKPIYELPARGEAAAPSLQCCPDSAVLTARESEAAAPSLQCDPHSAVQCLQCCSHSAVPAAPSLQRHPCSAVPIGPSTQCNTCNAIMTAGNCPDACGKGHHCGKNKVGGGIAVGMLLSDRLCRVGAVRMVL